MSSKPVPMRSRPWYFVVLLSLISLGLASRRFPGLFPATLGKYPGDALWALMVFIGWGFLRPSCPTILVAAFTLGTSYFVEFFKFCHVPVIDAIRNTPLGHLILGYAFSWENLLAYTVGAGIGTLAEFALQARRI